MSSHEFDYELETGPMGRVTARVLFDHQPRESATHNYPGCAPSIDIGAVEVAGFDIQDMLTKAEYGDIEDACWAHMEELAEQEWSRMEAMREARAEAHMEKNREDYRQMAVEARGYKQ